MAVEPERIVVVDQSDPNRGRIDRSRFGKPNPTDTESYPVTSPEDFEATRRVGGIEAADDAEECVALSLWDAGQLGSDPGNYVAATSVDGAAIRL